MGSATLGSSIVNLVKAIIGSGILGCPFVFGQTGLLLGIAVLFFCGACQAFTVHLLAVCVLQANGCGKESSFTALALQAFGGRQIGGTLVSICALVFAYGASVSYFIIIGDLLPEVFQYFGMVGAPWNSRHFWMSAIGWGIELPLSFLPNMDSFKVSSIIGNAGIMYIVIVAAAFACELIEVPPVFQSVSFFPPSPSEYTTIEGLIQSFPIFVFAFGCTLNVPTLILELSDPTTARVDTMVLGGVAIAGTLYMITGICGAYAFGASVAGNCLKNFPNEFGTTGGLVSIFARVAIVLNVMGAIPLYMHPLRGVTSELLFGKAPKDLKSSVRMTVALVIFILTWGLGMMVKSLDEVMAFVGSSSHIMLGFTLPALFFCLINNNQREVMLGVELQNQEGAIAATDTGVQSTKSGGAKCLSWGMAIGSIILIPILLSISAYKMSKETK